MYIYIFYRVSHTHVHQGFLFVVALFKIESIPNVRAKGDSICRLS